MSMNACRVNQCDSACGGTHAQMLPLVYKDEGTAANSFSAAMIREASRPRLLPCGHLVLNSST